MHQTLETEKVVYGPKFQIMDDKIVLPYPFMGKHFDVIKLSFPSIFRINEQKRTITLPYTIPIAYKDVPEMNTLKYR